jgi:hypothetical protein
MVLKPHLSACQKGKGNSWNFGCRDQSSQQEKVGQLLLVDMQHASLKPQWKLVKFLAERPKEKLLR